MTDEEIIRCISPEMLHGRIAAIYMLTELKRFYGVK